MAYEMIVTDVTCYGTLFCVAGWDRHAACMVRPEPPGANAAYEASRFWSAQFAGPGRLFSVGNVVSFEAEMPPAAFPFPHATEDRLFDLQSPAAVLGQLTLADVAAAAAGGISPTLEIAFDGGLIRAASAKAHVPNGRQGRSLGAIEIAPNQIVFHEDAYNDAKPKLRAMITVGDIPYDLSVTAEAVRTRWKAAGLPGLGADLKASNRLHIRLGLSRPFAAKPNECYAQVNGVYFL